MIIIITMSEKIFSLTNLSSVLRIDLVVFMFLIGFLITREFLNLYFVKNALNQPYTKLNKRLIDIIMIPFLYIFIYVLIFRLLNTIYST
jgi:succinate dehydrogenase/fumarate reductase cytochrome b subunit